MLTMMVLAQVGPHVTRTATRRAREDKFKVLLGISSNDATSEVGKRESL